MAAMRTARGLLLVSPFLLASCESFNLRPPAVDNDVNGSPTDTEATVLAHAQDIQQKYLDAADNISAERNYFNLPIIGAAGAAAGALVFAGGPVQSNIVKGTGLGAAMITTTQSYLSPSDRMSAYSRGADAVSCVIDSGNILAGGIDTTQPTMRSTLQALNQALQTAKAVEASSPSAGAAPTAPTAPQNPGDGATADQKAAFVQASAQYTAASEKYKSNISTYNAQISKISTYNTDLPALKSAESAGQAAADALQSDLSSLDTAIPDTKSALRSIITKIRNAIYTAKTADFNQTRDALVAAATQSAGAAQKKAQAAAGGQTTPDGAQPRTGGTPSPAANATKALNTEISKANELLKFEFTQAKAKMAACPASI